jgi:hypothetical protein
MFPAGRPGIGLLLLRLAVASSLVLDDPAGALSLPPTQALIIVLPLAAAICLGLLTPALSVACGLLALLHLRTELTLAIDLPLLLLNVCAAAALALIGPGAYSIDARLFGRRVITVPRNSGGPPGVT